LTYRASFQLSSLQNEFGQNTVCSVDHGSHMLLDLEQDLVAIKSCIKMFLDVSVRDKY